MDDAVLWMHERRPTPNLQTSIRISLKILQGHQDKKTPLYPYTVANIGRNTRDAKKSYGRNRIGKNQRGFAAEDIRSSYSRSKITLLSRRKIWELDESNDDGVESI